MGHNNNKMTQKIMKRIVILIYYILFLEIVLSREDEKAKKQKLRSAFRQSLLTVDTIYEDIDPSNEEQTASLLPIPSSLRGSSSNVIIKKDDDDEEMIIKSDNIDNN